ncbi:PAS domain-containing protein [Phenylobacterium sp. LjRoot219]|uniref:PAS domain S-box protein n=1 Tax=Phenylobacterium sp. LjRoot219 TaxID=3342283 RepID=UPI003ED10869
MTDANLAREVAALRQQLAQRSRSLEEAEARYHAVFNSALNPMSICTTDGIILDVNKAALRAIDASIEAFIGKHLWESPWFAQNPQEAAKVETAITRHRGQYIEYDSDVLSPNGERRTFQFVLRPYRSYVGGDARFLVLEVHDNTAIRTKAQIQEAKIVAVRPVKATLA